MRRVAIYDGIMPNFLQVSAIAQTIQLSLAPVFMLAAIGQILNVLAGRLARVIDRARILEQRVLVPEQNRIYLEWPEGKPPSLPPGYELLREKQAGQVCFGLARYQHPPK